MLAFEEAIRLNASAIETDVHLSSDDVPILLHDPLLDRTTNGSGLARDMPYYGGIDQLRSKRRPHSPVPRLEELIELLMRCPHVQLNLDIKESNDPQKLFSLVHAIISRQPDYLTTLAPRLVISVWHPAFLRAASIIMPYAQFAHLGCVPQLARELCWQSCSYFMMSYACLQTDEGQRFIKDCKAAGKKVGVWTVNDYAGIQCATCLHFPFVAKRFVVETHILGMSTLSSLIGWIAVKLSQTSSGVSASPLWSKNDI